MSRGRPVAGDPELMRQVSAALDRIVALPRERGKLAGDIADMRGRIEREKPAANAFDVKLARGGLVDCEFAAQFLMLSGLGRVAGETTLETLQRGADAGAMAIEEGEALIPSAAVQGGLLQVLRVADEKSFAPDEASDALKRLLLSFAADASHGGAAAAGDGGEFQRFGGWLEELQLRTRAALESLLGTGVG